MANVLGTVPEFGEFSSAPAGAEAAEFTKYTIDSMSAVTQASLGKVLAVGGIVLVGIAGITYGFRKVFEKIGLKKPAS